MCSEDTNAARGLKACAVAQDQLERYEELVGNPLELRKALKAYRERCGTDKNGKKKRNGFRITQYKEEQRKVSAVYYDRQKEMMNLKAFQHFKAKPKNGGLDADEATREFNEMAADPEVFKDYKGPSAKFRMRVAVPTKDIILDRDGTENIQIVSMSDKENRRSGEKEMEELQSRLRSGPLYQEHRADVGRRLVLSAAASAASGSADGAFSNIGLAAANFGSIHDFKKELAEDSKIEVDADEEETVETQKDGLATPSPAPSKPPSKDDRSSTTSQKKPWFNRDEKILAELQKHRAWEITTKTTLNQTKQRLLDVMAAIGKDVEDHVENEVKLLKNRLRAVKLVLMESEETTQATAQSSSAGGVNVPNTGELRGERHGSSKRTAEVEEKPAQEIDSGNSEAKEEGVKVPEEKRQDLP